MTNKTSASIWTSITQLSDLAQMLAAVVVLAPIVATVFLIVVNGLASDIPVWTLAIGVFVSALGGFGVGRLAAVRSTQGTRRELRNSGVLFVPFLSGWTLSGCEKESVTVERKPDGSFGDAVRIALPVGAFMDYTVPREFQLNTKVEFAAELQLIYAKVRIRSRNSQAEQSVWLALHPGTNVPVPCGDGSFEWNYPVQPETVELGWSQYEIKLQDAVRDTFGRNGWSFVGVVGFRLRLDNTFGYLRISL